MSEEKNKGCPIDKNEAFKYYSTPKKNGRMKSYEDVAKKFNASVPAIEQIGSKNDWVRKREEYGKRSLERHQLDVEKKISESNKKLFDAWDDATDLLKKCVRKQRKVFDGEVVEKTKLGKAKKTKFSPWAFREIVESLNKVQKAQRVILGMPNEITKGEMTNLIKESPLSKEELEAMEKDFKKIDDKSIS